MFANAAVVRASRRARPAAGVTLQASPRRAAGTISVTFVKPDGSRVVVAAPIGANMLEVAHANKIDIEGAWPAARRRVCPSRVRAVRTVSSCCPSLSRARSPARPPARPVPRRAPAGACGGETACSTCHVYGTAPAGAALPAMEEAEEDMLDLAAGLADDSRLGCQVVATAALDGLVVRMPKEVNNLLK